MWLPLSTFNRTFVGPWDFKTKTHENCRYDITISTHCFSLYISSYGGYGNMPCLFLATFSPFKLKVNQENSATTRTVLHSSKAFIWGVTSIFYVSSDYTELGCFGSKGSVCWFSAQQINFFESLEYTRSFHECSDKPWHRRKNGFWEATATVKTNSQNTVFFLDGFMRYKMNEHLVIAITGHRLSLTFGNGITTLVAQQSGVTLRRLSQ